MPLNMARNKTIPWLYDMPAKFYHSDPSPTPSLSSSIAKKLVLESPLEAWAAHPRLNRRKAEEEEESTDALDRGEIIHQLLLGGEDRVAIIDHDSFRTKVARAERDLAIANGKIPVKSADWDKYLSSTDFARRALCESRPDMDLRDGLRLEDGACEGSALWTYDHRGTPVSCRTRFDHVEERGGLIWVNDIKTCASAHPDSIVRAIQTKGYDIQADFYRRAIESLVPAMVGRVRFRFWFLQLSSPMTVIPVELDGQFAELGKLKVDYAFDQWVQCMESGCWPTYNNGKLLRATPDKWMLSRWYENEAVMSVNYLAEGEVRE